MSDILVAYQYEFESFSIPELKPLGNIEAFRCYKADLLQKSLYDGWAFGKKNGIIISRTNNTIFIDKDDEALPPYRWLCELSNVELSDFLKARQ